MRRAFAIATVTMSLIASACGGGDATAPSRPANTGPITTTLPPPLEGTVLPVSQEFWHSGFHVRIEAAEVWTTTTLLTNRISHWLTLRGDFANQGAEIATFEPEMAIVAGGVSYNKRGGDPPRLLPATSALGELTFLIPDDLDLQAAHLVIGAPDESQARIPLGSDGTAIRLQPTELAISGAVAMELVDFTFTGGSLRYDIPDLHRQLDSGKAALTLHFDVTSRHTRDTRISMDDVALVLPDGSVVAPAVAELGPLPGGDDGVNTADRSVSFVVDEMLTGDLTLQVQLDPRLVVDDGATEAIFTFTL